MARLLLGLCLVVGLSSALGGEPPHSCIECQAVVVKDAAAACASSNNRVACKSQFVKLKASCTKLVDEVCVRNCTATQAKACSGDAVCVMPFGGVDADSYCECKRGFTGDGFRCIVDPEIDESVEATKLVAATTGAVFKPKADICFEKLGVKNGGCHGDASCGFHPQTNEMLCRCNAGFQGDGQSCVGTFVIRSGPLIIVPNFVFATRT